MSSRRATSRLDALRPGAIGRRTAGSGLRSRDKRRTRARLRPNSPGWELARVAAGTLGKYQLAKRLIDELLLAPPAAEVLVSALIQAAKCWQWLGGTEVGLALIERAEQHLTPERPAREQAYVSHAKASMLIGLGRFDEADAALNVALEAYRNAKDDAGYCRALGTRIRMHLERKDPAAALSAAQAARMYAQRHHIERLRLLYSIEEAHAHLLLGNLTSCLSHLGQVVAESVGTDDKVVRFYAHYYFWKAFDKAGDGPRAKVEFETAARYVEFLDEVTPEAVHVRTLLSQRQGSKVRRLRKD